MNKDREDISAIYESIYAGDAVYGDDDKEKDEKDTDTEDVDEKDTEDSSDDGEKSSSDNDSSDKGDDDDKKDNPFGDGDSDDSDDDESDDSDDDSEDSDDTESEEGEEGEEGESEGGDPKGDGSFSTDVDSLRKQYSELLANVFSEFAPDAIEAALDGSDGPFGDNIQTIIQTAIDHLKGMIYDEFELEELELDAIDPSAMGSFDPNAASDVPMELDIGSPVPELDGVMDTDVGEDEDTGPDLEIPTADSNEDVEEDEEESDLEESCKKHKKKVSKLEESVKRFEPTTMGRSRMAQTYIK